MASTPKDLKHDCAVKKKPKKFALLVHRRLLAVITPVVMAKCLVFGAEKQKWKDTAQDLCCQYHLTCHGELLL